MKLSVNLFMTLDGVCQGPGGAEEDTRGGFTNGGWLMPVFDEGCGEAVTGWFDQCDALLLGRRTYDIFISHWPQVTEGSDPVAGRINGNRKYVVTSAPVDDTTWEDTTTVLGEDFLEEIRQLKAEGGEGELQVHGSVMLARTLHEAGLVDTYRLLVAPVLVGKGAGIFKEDSPAYALDVVSATPTPNGVIAYELTPREFDNSLTIEVEDGREVVREA